MFAGLLWKPWSSGIAIIRRKKTHKRKQLVAKVTWDSLFLYSQKSVVLGDDLAAPLINVLLKWSKQFWATSSNFIFKLCSLACMSLVQDMFRFNFELAAFFKKYWLFSSSHQSHLSVAALASRRKRFFFVRQKPKRFLLWYWSATLAQSSVASSIMFKPYRTVYVLNPVGFFLKKKKLMRTKKKA